MIVYKTTNTINGKIYIGQTRSKDNSYLGSGILIKKAIEKYGRHNFIRETLCECSSQEELDKMERYLIKELNSKSPDIGYNVADGGYGGGTPIGFKHSKISCENMSKSRIGIIFTSEHKENLRLSQLGKSKSMDTRMKMKQSRLNVPNDVRQKISQSMTGLKRGSYKKSEKQIEKERGK